MDEKTLKQIVWAWERAESKIIGDRDFKPQDFGDIIAEVRHLAPKFTPEQIYTELRRNADRSFDDL